MATEKDARTVVEDYVEAWGAQFPQSRFTGRTVETARLSVAPQEVVDVVAAAVCAELRRLYAAAMVVSDGNMDRSNTADTRDNSQLLLGRSLGSAQIAHMADARADEIEAQS